MVLLVKKTQSLQPILTYNIEELVELDLTFLEKSGENLESTKIVLILIDHFSKYIILKPIFPITLLSDSEGEFKNEKLDK